MFLKKHSKLRDSSLLDLENLFPPKKKLIIINLSIYQMTNLYKKRLRLRLINKNKRKKLILLKVLESLFLKRKKIFKKKIKRKNKFKQMNQLKNNLKQSSVCFRNRISHNRRKFRMNRVNKKFANNLLLLKKLIMQKTINLKQLSKKKKKRNLKELKELNILINL